MSLDKRLLQDQLASARRHVTGTLAGLDDQQLRATPLPSGWSPLGMVRHLAYDDERFWFCHVIAGEPFDYRTAPDPWEVPAEATGRRVLAEYHRACQRSDEILASTDLDAAPRWWPDFFGEWRLETNREVVLHVVAETAVHTGHLDAARELIDGKQWLVVS